MSAAARDIFVDNAGGDDKNNGLHPQNQGDTASPVRTIAKALRLARAGDRVVLANSPEPYRECVALVGTRHSGAARLMPFIFDGNGATLDGSAPIPADGWTHFRDNIFRFRPKTLIQPVLFLNGRSIPPLPLPQATAYPPRLKPLQWCAIEGAIYFAVEPGRLPPDYKLSYAELPTGITLYQVDQVVIRNLTIRGFQADGVAPPAAPATWCWTTSPARPTARAAFACGAGPRWKSNRANSRATAGNVSQLLTLPNSETHLLASELANDTARGWVDQGGRVYLGSKRIEGGRKAIRPGDAPQAGGTRKRSRKGKIMTHDKLVGRPMEVLLVEDDMEDAGLTIETLREGQVPCRVSLVCDGEEALAFLRREAHFARVPRPDMILLDMQMPKKDGRAVLAEIRGDPELCRIPVVVLTGSQTHGQILKEENLRAENFLTKPVDREHFHGVVKSLRKFMLSDVILPT